MGTKTYRLKITMIDGSSVGIGGVKEEDKHSMKHISFDEPFILEEEGTSMSVNMKHALTFKYYLEKEEPINVNFNKDEGR